MIIATDETENVIYGKVEYLEKLGEASYLYVRVTEDAETVTVRQSGDSQYKMGDETALYLKPVAFMRLKKMVMPAPAPSKPIRFRTNCLSPVWWVVLRCRRKQINCLAYIGCHEHWFRVIGSESIDIKL